MRDAILATTSVAFPAGAIFAMAGTSDAAIEALREQVATLTEQSQGIVAQADEEDRDLSDDEVEEINGIGAQVDRLRKQISARETVAASQASAGRRTLPEPQNNGDPASNGRRTVPAQPRANDPRHGFTNFGAFAQAVRLARNPEAGEHEGVKKLLNAATTYGNEGIGADGGFAVPPEFRREIWQKVMGEDNLATRCDRNTTSSNTFVVPSDETTPWGTAGIRAYWDGEGDAINASKPQLSQKSVRLNRLTALVPVTEELLEDAPGLESYIRSRAPMVMTAKMNTAIIAGTGVGQPLGILKSPALVSAAAETSQAADTILYANIVQMWSRMYAPARRNAVWLINQDIEPQLLAMAFDPDATAGKVPVYLPANGAAGSPFATLMGRPVVPVEAASTLGDLGDIILADLTQYMIVTKGQDIRTDVSIHLYFDQALTAFRFIWRVTGQPWWAAAIQPQNAVSTRSAFVTLAERS